MLSRVWGNRKTLLEVKAQSTAVWVFQGNLVLLYAEANLDYFLQTDIIRSGM